MSSIYYNTAGVQLADILPLESNGPDNKSTPRLIVDVEFLDKSFPTPTDAFIVNDDVSARFVNGFAFDVVGGPYAGSYTVDLPGFLPNDVVAQVVDGKTHIPVTNITSTAVPYDFYAGFTSPSISPVPNQPGNYHVTWQLAGNLSGILTAGDEVLFKHILYNGTRLHRMDTVVSVTVTNGGSYTNVVTALYDDAFMPVIGVDAQSVMVTPIPAVAELGYVQYTVTPAATTLRIVGRGSPMYNDTVTWGNAMQSNMIQMLEHFANDTTAPSSPIPGQLWLNTNTTVGPALMLRATETVRGLDWYGVVAEGLPVQGDLNMNDHKIAKVTDAATTFPYVASTTGWGNNDQEAMNLRTCDSLYIAKTGGYDANSANRSGTMFGSLYMQDHRIVFTNMSLNDGNGNGAVAPDISFNASGVLASQEHTTLIIDSDNTGVGSLVISKGSTSTASDINLLTVLLTGEVRSNIANYTSLVTNDNTLTNKKYVDDTTVSVTGDTMSGNLVMTAGSTVTGLPDPVNSSDAANKSYVDMFVSGIVWLRPVFDPSLFNDTLTTPPVDDGFDKYHRTYIVATPGTGAWAGLDGHLVAWDGSAWQSVLGRPVQAGDRFGVFCSPDNDDPLATLPGGGLTGHAGKIAEVTSVSPYAYSFYVPAEPDAFSVVGVAGSAPYQSPHMGHSYTFRGQYGVGTYGTDFSWIVFSGPQMIIDGAGLRYDANVLNTDGKVRSLYDLTAPGILVADSANTVTSREITGTAGNIVVTNGTGITDNPHVNLAIVTQSNTGTSFVKVRLDAYGRVVSNAPVSSTDIAGALGYTPADAANLTAHVNDTTDAHPASAITNTPLGNITSTTVQGAINELDTDKVSKSGDTMSGSLNLGGNQITSLGSPTSSTDAVNKAYVDAVAQGLAVKPAVKAATTANLVATYYNGAGDDGIGATLTSTTNGMWPGLDGVTTGWVVTSGVLVKDQTASLQNGRYYLSDLGSASTPWVLTRCYTCDESHEIPSSFVFVQEGTQAGTGWAALTGTPLGADPNTFEVGYDAIVYTQFSGVGTYEAGLGLSLTGTVFDVNVDGSTIVVNADTLQVKPNTYVQVSGDTMTGALTLSGDPSAALHAAPKQYVDPARVMALAASVTGTVPANAKVLMAITAQAFTIEATPATNPCYGYADITATTGDAVFDIQKNGVSVGSMTFHAGVSAHAAEFSFASPVSFVAGDRITVVAPGTPDATLADVYFTLRGTLV